MDYYGALWTRGVPRLLDFKLRHRDCDFEMSMLSLSGLNVTGNCYNRSNSGTYQFQDLYLQMDGTLEGSYHQLRGVLTFPSSTFTVSGNVASAMIDSVALPMSSPGNRITFSTDQIVGSSPPSTTPNPITLNFIFDVPGGTALVSLTSR